MATPTLEAVLRTPELAAAIDSCTELLPGVPASKENLKKLLDEIGNSGGVSLLKSPPRDGPNWLDGGEVLLQCVKNGKRPSDLYVRISSAEECYVYDFGPEQVVSSRRPVIDMEKFKYTEDGLAEALAWAKERATRLRAENYCPACRRDGAINLETSIAMHPPQKKLKMSGSQFCAKCILEKAVFG